MLLFCKPVFYKPILGATNDQHSYIGMHTCYDKTHSVHRSALQRIMAVKYSFPPGLAISPECADLLARIFVASPQQRITIPQIRAHPWFRINLPAELAVGGCCWSHSTWVMLSHPDQERVMLVTRKSSLHKGVEPSCFTPGHAAA
jgi:hypothetical protein